MDRVSSDKCTGCGACKNICPRNAIVWREEKGFLYPDIRNEKCTDCGLCGQVCPVNKEVQVHKEAGFPKWYALKIGNDAERMKSQSGGAFWALACAVWQRGGIVYGCVLDEELKAVHKRAVCEKEGEGFRGSKYVWSDVRDTFLSVSEDLKKEIPVLYSGTPCQIDGLYCFLKIKNCNTENLYTIDLICHAVGSPRIYEDYRKFWEKKRRRKMETFHFRDKRYNWGSHIETMVFSDKKKISRSYYRELFYSGVICRASCNVCRYANLSRKGDITIADCWGIGAIAPEFGDVKGVSLVLVNTEKGKDLFSKCQNISCIEINYDIKYQPNLQKPFERPECSKNFWEDYKEMSFTDILRKYAGYSWKNELKSSLTNRLRLIKNRCRELI